MQDWQDALLVYSTESGKIKPEPKEQARSVSSDGVVRIHPIKGIKLSLLGANVTLAS